MVCPSNSSKLLGAESSFNAQSPWVIAVNMAGIRALPSITKAVVLVAGISAGNSYVFMGSRYLYALASNHQASRVGCSRVASKDNKERCGKIMGGVYLAEPFYILK